MARRVGVLLVEAAIIRPDQLREALQAQVLVGGRIGTNLVEQCGIKLDDLAEALGRQHGLPPALARHFERADPSIHGRLSPRLAARWSAVPLGALDGGRIAVAVPDPLPDEGRDELGRALGGEVLVAVAPELRLLYQLEHVFGIRRPNRFLRVAPRRSSPVPRDERRRYVPTLSDTDSPEPPEPLARVAVQRIAVEAVPAEEEPPAETFPDALKAIRRATGRERVADIVISALESGFAGAVTCAMLLVVRDGTALGWKGFCHQARDERIEAVAVPLDESSMLANTLHRGPFCGAPPEPTQLDDRLWQLLGGRPASVAVAPVEAGGRTACLVYAHSDRPDALSGLAGHRISELAQSMSAAFDRLVRAAER